MTGRERITNILNGKPADRLAWTTLIDEPTRSLMDDGLRLLHPFEFYRLLGCDILQFGDHGFYGTSEAVGLPACLVTPEIETITTPMSDGASEIIKKTEWGTLTSIEEEGHPIKYPVTCLEELLILKNIWLNSHFKEDSTDGYEKRLASMEKKIGESGIYVHTIGPSPVQRLLEFDTGLINFNILLADYPEEVEELLDVMHHCRKQEYEILARRTSVDCIIPVENTSTAMISPCQYEKYSLPQITDFVNIMHHYNKKAVLHMCGHLKALLPIIRQSGLDGINALTPPPIGDTDFSDALRMFGKQFVILGGMFDSTIFHDPGASKQVIWQSLDKIFTPELREANFLLWIQADGIPTAFEKLAGIKEWMEQQ